MRNNNLNHCNPTATIGSSSSKQIDTKNNIIKTCTKSSMHSQQSLSMPHSKIPNKICHACTEKNINICEFTNQRCSYERMTQKQLLPPSSEQVIRCHASNSRTPTRFDDKNHNHGNYAEYEALNKFRMQNSKECFSDHHHRLQRLQSRPPSESSSTATISNNTKELNWYLNNIVGDNKKLPLTPIPYALRQRALRNQLAKDFTHRKSVSLGLNKSTALSYHLNGNFEITQLGGK